MIDKDRFFRLAEYGTCYALTVPGTEHKSFQNEQVERALQQSDAVVGITSGRHPTQVNAILGSDVNMSLEESDLGCA